MVEGQSWWKDGHGGRTVMVEGQSWWKDGHGGKTVMVEGQSEGEDSQNEWIDYIPACRSHWKDGQRLDIGEVREHS